MRKSFILTAKLAGNCLLHL